jgi:hypothetical protein
MPTQKQRRRVRDEIAALAGFPPEGISQPFKSEPMVWTQRFPFCTGGENHMFPPDSIGPDEAVFLSNWRPMSYGLIPAMGYNNVGSPKASPVEILNVVFYKELDGTSRLVRLDEDDLQHWNGSSWTTITGGGAAMTGTDADPIRSTMALNLLVWVNGVDVPKKWQEGDANYSNLTADVNAPATARHVVAFADRVVFADIGTGASRNPQRVEWSASGAPTDFTTLGAGGATLFDTSDESASDDIMALKVFDTYLVVVRQRSIWLGQRTGEVAAPIRFYSVLQGIGTIASDSVQTVGDLGIMFLGRDNVYLFHPENRGVIPIGETIKKALFQTLDATKLVKVRSGYNTREDSYHIFLPASDDTWAQESYVCELSRYKNEERFVWWRRPYSADPVTYTTTMRRSPMTTAHPSH